jgi:hypothetical protein
VVNCKYKVKMNYRMKQSSQGTVGFMIGNLEALVEGDGQAYQGTATLHTDRTESMAPCSFSTNGFDNPAAITVQPAGSQDEQLQLSVAYQPGQQSATITCPIAGANTTNTTVNPADWLATNATFLNTGGAHSFPIDYAQWFGQLIITVEPVDVNS